MQVGCLVVLQPLLGPFLKPFATPCVTVINFDFCACHVALWCKFELVPLKGDARCPQTSMVSAIHGFCFLL